MIRRSLPLLALLAVPLAFAQTTDAGGLIRDAAGKTLYTFDQDAGGVSACYDGCAALWPPYLAPADAKAKDKLTVHKRKDGKMQWGWGGKPLYTYAADAKAGDATGDNVGGVWHVIKK